MRSHLEKVVNFLTVASCALLIESIDLIDSLTFMIPTQKKKIVWIANFVGEEKDDSLEVLVTAVHIIPQKEIIDKWWEAATIEETQNISVLSMRITTDFNRWLYLHQRRLA